MVLVSWVVACTPSTGLPVSGAGLDPPLPAGGLVGVEGHSTLQLLQLNLCDSGFAGCYTGRSTAEAAALIHARTPDLVTLNEVCEDDVAVLARALGETRPGGSVASAFQAALDTRTTGAMRCRAGRRYGIGVLSRWPVVPGPAVTGGNYPAGIQDRRSPEGRAWLCVDAAAEPAIIVCTTHLANDAREVARAQCHYLFDTIIAQLRARAGATPVVVGADLNLAGADGPWSCTPPGFAHVDDAGLQHVLGTPGFVVRGRGTYGLHGATDHPGLLVTLARTGEEPDPTP